MIVIADAGPLIALAKVDALPILFAHYPHALITPAVYEEAVRRGQAVGAEDATRLEAAINAEQIEVREPAPGELPVPALLGAGEVESILLAIQANADWLLLDDLAARRAARKNFAAAGTATQVQGTLGVLVSAAAAGHITYARAIEVVQTLKGRPDIWLSPELCDRVIHSLQQAA